MIFFRQRQRVLFPMARYIKLLLLPPAPGLSQTFVKTLRDHNLEITFSSNDYIVAQEKPGKFPYLEMVTIEILVSSPDDPDDRRVCITLLAKNQRLALQQNNHCQQVFEAVSRDLIEASRQYQGAGLASVEC